jgi:hypothetical protein
METLAPLDMQAVRSQCYPKRQTRVISLGAYMSGRSKTNPASTLSTFIPMRGGGALPEKGFLYSYALR